MTAAQLGIGNAAQQHAGDRQQEEDQQEQQRRRDQGGGLDPAEPLASAQPPPQRRPFQGGADAGCRPLQAQRRLAIAPPRR